MATDVARNSGASTWPSMRSRKPLALEVAPRIERVHDQEGALVGVRRVRAHRAGHVVVGERIRQRVAEARDEIERPPEPYRAHIALDHVKARPGRSRIGDVGLEQIDAPTLRHGLRQRVQMPPRAAADIERGGRRSGEIAAAGVPTHALEVAVRVRKHQIVEVGLGVEQAAEFRLHRAKCPLRRCLDRHSEIASRPLHHGPTRRSSVPR